MSKYYRLLPLALATVVAAAAVPAPAGAAALPKASTVQPQQSRLGFRSGARRAPAFGSRVRSRSRSRVRPIRSFRPLRGLFGGILRALGLAYLFHLLFGWGTGGGPFGLLLLGALILFFVTRRRRRRAVYW